MRKVSKQVDAVKSNLVSSVKCALQGALKDALETHTVKVGGAVKDALNTHTFKVSGGSDSLPSESENKFISEKLDDSRKSHIDSLAASNDRMYQLVVSEKLSSERRDRNAQDFALRMTQIKAGSTPGPAQMPEKSRPTDLGEWDKEALSCALNESGLVDIAVKFLQHSISGVHLKLCYEKNSLKDLIKACGIPDLDFMTQMKFDVILQSLKTSF